MRRKCHQNGNKKENDEAPCSPREADIDNRLLFHNSLIYVLKESEYTERFICKKL